MCEITFALEKYEPENVGVIEFSRFKGVAGEICEGFLMPKYAEISISGDKSSYLFPIAHRGGRDGINSFFYFGFYIKGECHSLEIMSYPNLNREVELIYEIVGHSCDQHACLGLYDLKACFESAVNVVQQPFIKRSGNTIRVIVREGVK